jgi:hypothetical protein
MDQRDVGGEKGVKEAKVVSTDRIRRILDIGGEVIERDKFILSWHRMVRRREGWASLDLLKDGCGDDVWDDVYLRARC